MTAGGGGRGNRDTRLLLIAAVTISGCSLLIVELLRAGLGNRQGLSIFYHLLLTQDSWGLLLVLACLLAWLRPLPFRLLSRLVGGLARQRWAVAGLVSVLLALAARTVYQAQALCVDEYAPLLQSKIFAAGRLVGQWPPELLDRLVWPSYHSFFFTTCAERGEIISGYWPGFALLLTPFTKLTLPWILNPLLAAAGLLLLHHLARELLGEPEAAGWAMLLALASPAFTINAISYYSTNAHLVMNLAFAVLLLRPSIARLIAAGAVGSFALVLHNPLPHLLFAIPWWVWITLKRGRLRNLSALGLGYLPLSLLLGVGWVALRMFLQAPSDAVAGGGLLAVFARGSDSVGLSSMFTPPDSFVLLARLLGFIKLWCWAVPGLLIVALIGWRRLRPEAREERPVSTADRAMAPSSQSGFRLLPAQLLAASALLTFFGYFFVPFDQGHGWGYRYFHSAWFVLPLFAAAALISKPDQPDPGRSRFVALVGTLAVLSLVIITPLRLAQVNSFVDRQLGQLPELDPGVRQVVFIDGHSGYYVPDLIQNDPFLRGPRIIMASHGHPADSAVMARHFPNARLTQRQPNFSVWQVPGRSGLR